jgi:mono/diheme cytochrome c family protein
VSCEVEANGVGRSRGTGGQETWARPGFSRVERLSLGLAAAAIAFWGWWGVDLDARRDPGPGAGGRVMASAHPDREEDAPAQAAPPAAGGSERGRQLFESSGCSSCHALDGSASIGPNLRGAWGTSQALADGTSVLFDRTYFEESVLHPEARIVRGYKPAMPSYDGLLNAADLDALAEYLRSLR